jgi:glucose/arabinose dehydrogenase
MTRKLTLLVAVGFITVFAIALTPSAAQAATAVLPPITHGTIGVSLQAVATGLGAPDFGVSPPGDTSRLFVIDQNGKLRVIENGSLLPTPALDLATVNGGLDGFNPASANDERGFLGLAFHPGFNNPASPGFQTIYTYSSAPVGTGPTYVAPNGATQAYKNVVYEFKMSGPTTVNPASFREVISFGKNATNHNGGTVAFGPDGYMYLALGDGGNANDAGPSHIEPTGNAQNLTTPLGKMLRFDPILPSLKPTSTDPISANGQYRIPADNPNMGAGQTVPEIYAMGLRNPYRFAFDRPDLGGTGNLIQADVGQNNIEEIDRIIKGGNYGWSIKEGTFQFFHTTGPLGEAPGTIGPNQPGSPAGLIDPIQGTSGQYLEYDHTQGISITGGFVYRGDDIPELVGKYIFGDLALRGAPVRADGRLFYADLTTGEIKEFLLPQFANDQLPNGLTVHGFGEDATGEIYAMVTNTPANGTGGIVYKFAPVPEPAGLTLAALSAMGAVARRRRRVALA